MFNIHGTFPDAVVLRNRVRKPTEPGGEWVHELWLNLHGKVVRFYGVGPDPTSAFIEVQLEMDRYKGFLAAEAV